MYFMHMKSAQREECILQRGHCDPGKMLCGVSLTPV